MVLCDLCGKDTNLAKTVIEGAVLKVCANCAKYGRVLEEKKEFFGEEQDIKPARHTIIERDEPVPEPLEEIFAPKGSADGIYENYAIIVKIAREKAKLTQADLAKAIAGKENTIHHIETKQQPPSMKTAKKLEQFLHIKLLKKEPAPNTMHALESVDFSETTLTIGDLLKIKQAKDSSK